eukprot:1368438-Pyramimonas_sp.AAC.1
MVTSEPCWVFLARWRRLVIRTKSGHVVPSSRPSRGLWAIIEPSSAVLDALTPGGPPGPDL